MNSRLHASGRYEVAELGCYDEPDDPRRKRVPWKFYGNSPTDDEERRAYDANPTNQFGLFRFNAALLDFRPDVVYSIRDHWMDEFIARSPFRRMFRWVHMPTVDATPQRESWLATYAEADACFAYTDWGAARLREEGGGRINVLGSAPPGADLETFRPLDRAEVRRRMGIPADAFVVGTAMRNQPRKLFPNLIADFAAFVAAAPDEIATKSLLYLHTSYPDVGWDLPRLIRDSGISHRVVMTYRCRACGAVMPCRYSDARTGCRACGAPEAYPPNVKFGVDRENLARVLNLFDAYVQYANSEGFGMPQVEAASCGVPVFAVDYSAMADVVCKVGGTPVACSLQMEPDMGCYRAIPSRDDFVGKLLGFASLSPAERAGMGAAARRGVERYYTWDGTAARWMETFDDVRGWPKTLAWDSPSREFTPPAAVPPQFASNEALVRWAITHELGRPDLVDSHMGMQLVRDLNWGATRGGPGGKLRDFGPDDMLGALRAMGEEFNRWERRRIGRSDTPRLKPGACS